MKTMSAVALVLLVASVVGGATEDLMKGKIRTGRSISLEIVVSGTPDEVSRLWLSEGSVQSFFAPKSHIEARVGGEYNMIFWPDKYPQGENFGTKGARILRLDPGRAIWFEWKSFVMEDQEARSSPPSVSPEEYAERPLPTWVEVEFEPVEGDKTRVRLSHQGFQTGGKWDESFVYFSRAWATVITGLSRITEKRESPPNDHFAPGQDSRPSCDASEYNLLDFWVGEWKVFLEATQVGTNKIEKILNGCAIVEHWRDVDGREGKSLFYLDGRTWKQVWVTDVGRFKDKRHILTLGDGGVRFQGTVRDAEGRPVLDRTTLTPLAGGRVRQVIEQSKDGGETWVAVFDAVYTRSDNQ